MSGMLPRLRCLYGALMLALSLLLPAFAGVVIARIRVESPADRFRGKKIAAPMYIK